MKKPEIAIEEDGDEVFTPMPKTCPQWRVTNAATLNGQVCGGKVENMGGFMRCKICFASFGPVATSPRRLIAG